MPTPVDTVRMRAVLVLNPPDSPATTPVNFHKADPSVRMSAPSPTIVPDPNGTMGANLDLIAY